MAHVRKNSFGLITNNQDQRKLEVRLKTFAFDPYFFF